jgi:dipeptidyl aminopeptidase/acylaminoacyl peptidase
LAPLARRPADASTGAGRVTGASGPTSDEIGSVEEWVRRHLERCGVPDGLGVVDVGQVAPSPDGRLVACTLHLREAFLAPTRRRVAVVDLDDGGCHPLDLPTPQSEAPTWSAQGRLAVVGVEEDGATAVLVVDVAGGHADVAARWDAAGLVEWCGWSPDGSRVAAQVALEGAEISDVHGSGFVGGGAGWQPRVLPASDGRRLATVWDPVTGECRDVGTRNVWELAWCGDDALLAVTTDAPDEGAWYAAVLTRVDVRSGRDDLVHRPVHQLAQPRSAPDGSAWSVLSGLQSDRGLPAGELVVGAAGAEPVVVDTAGVHVTDHQWLDRSTVLVAGLRGLETVVAQVRVDAGDVRTVWSGEATSGGLRPEVAGVVDRPPVLVLEDHEQPPSLCALHDDGPRPVLTLASAGTRHQAEQAGTTTTVSWASSDGLEVQGLLTLPDGAGPHALVLHVHGGPTHAWRRTWSGRDPHTSALVARGYAVLRPNPRGSSGRGAAFAEAVAGDVGGLDADDVLGGVEHLVRAGVADPARLGITGISYGGYMSAWVPCRSDLFSAAVARSPATDMVTQHLTSNIAEFDARFVQGDPFDPASAYTTRSPLQQHRRNRTPTLLTAGLLDLATPASQAQVLYTALTERGVAAGLVLYPEEGHGVLRPEAVVDQVARMVAWFEHFMPARPA